MQRFWIYLTLGLVSGGAALTLHDVHQRISRLEVTPRADPAQLASMRTNLDRIERSVGQSLDLIGELRHEGERTRELNQRLAGLEADLQSAARELVEQKQRLSGWEESQRDAPRQLESIFATRVDSRVDGLRASLDEQCRRLSEIAERALGLAQNTRSEMEQVEQDLARDEERMWRELVGPVVQLQGEETVGSGVLLASEPVPGTQDWRTFVLTAWHVVRDIEKDPEHPTTPVPVTIYGEDRQLVSETATVLRFDAGLDVALLQLDCKRRIDCGARVASRERLRGARIFDQVYAVGCPLGNDPIPTFGEIADTRHVVDGSRYWMISAPTYIGNSGGGIFDARTHELMGIFSKIYTHGTLRPTVVPHMGLVTSVEPVFEWLDALGYAGIPARAGDVQVQTAAAQK